MKANRPGVAPLGWLLAVLALAVPPLVHAQQLVQAMILVAAPQLDDPFFANSVVLVTRHGGGPPLGLILNRPLPSTEGKAELPVFLGGPVMPEQSFFLVEQSAVAAGDMLNLGHEIHLGTGEASLARQRAATPPPRKVRRFAGYAGWGYGQLENEIHRGDWRLVPFEPELLFREDVSSLWQELLQRARRRAT